MKLINKSIRESDIVVIDLNTTPVFEAEQVINQLKDNFNLNTTIILLTNLMTWYNTPPKKEAMGEEENQDEQGGETEEKADDINVILRDLYGEMAETDPEKAKQIIENLKKT